MPGDTAFDAALAALDVEPTHHTDRMVTTYDILGLDAVRAAHRAEVERAVKEEREACAKACIAQTEGMDDALGSIGGWCRVTLGRAADAIRARGAKS